MDHDDPEKRIADLERQLAQSRVAHPGASSRLTAEQVHNVAFSKPPWGKRGYNEDEVDAFLDRVEAALRDPMRSLLTPEQVRGVAFSKPPIGKRGYNEDEVDVFLDVVAEQFEIPVGRLSRAQLAPVLPLSVSSGPQNGGGSSSMSL